MYPMSDYERFCRMVEHSVDALNDAIEFVENGGGRIVHIKGLRDAAAAACDVLADLRKRLNCDICDEAGASVKGFGCQQAYQCDDIEACQRRFKAMGGFGYSHVTRKDIDDIEKLLGIK